MGRKGKVILSVAVGLLLLGAAIAAALNAVFTVTDIRVNYSILSPDGGRDSYALQKKLEESFVGKSTTFLALDDVRAAAEEFPCFKVEKTEKKFPRTVVMEISERRELYAVPLDAGKFAVLDEDGNYLYDKAENVNRRGGENVLLAGFALQTAGSGVTGSYYPEALAFLNVFSERLGDIRANIVSLTLTPTGNPLAGNVYFRLQMREGVYIDVLNPEHLTEQKAVAVLEKYLSLSDVQRLYGFFDVVDALSGGFTVSEHRAELPLG